MFIQLGKLYINTEQIFTIGIYEVPGTTESKFEIGLVINGNKYALYIAAENGVLIPDTVKQLENNLLYVLSEIIKQTKQEVVKIDIPKVNLPKQEQTTVPAVTQEVQKEQIND